MCSFPGSCVSGARHPRSAPSRTASYESPRRVTISWRPFVVLSQRSSFSEEILSCCKCRELFHIGVAGNALAVSLGRDAVPYTARWPRPRPTFRTLEWHVGLVPATGAGTLPLRLHSICAYLSHLRIPHELRNPPPI